MRELVSPQGNDDAMVVARRMVEAMRDCHTLCRIAAQKETQLDVRYVARKSLSTSVELLRLPRRCRPEHHVQIAAHWEISGSMTVYERASLSCLPGLIRVDRTTDANLFDTQLARLAGAFGRRSLAGVQSPNPACRRFRRRIQNRDEPRVVWAHQCASVYFRLQRGDYFVERK